MSAAEHKERAPERLHVGVITVSDSRAAAMKEGRDEDISGRVIEEELAKEGHSSDRTILFDEEDEIREKIEELVSNPEVDAIITTGGTGIARRDRTVDVACSLLNKELPGFGETLRRIGYEEHIGGPALLTRATAGIISRVPIFCLPGAPNSVRVAMKLILPELPHVVKHARE
ncbi:hypothetical protein AKJ58_01185 [candidate division MSBL1 archaeon SCGC-AAA385D11]|uniref:MoaB/Mog domain-containing protein n=1 Tax=candidate division MSBL1 archaeon SCGC-AAA385D11 TaxID=1698286 RepID=A0A133VNI8_9EURY|nr:hypothetical protein AKJ58_01185 [candidate division MSBL1 archaeon SCGC-AAA385D11]